MTRAVTPPGVRTLSTSDSSRGCGWCSENTAEVVLVADYSPSGALSQKLAFGCQEIKEGLAFGGLDHGQGEGDGQALKGADQVQVQVEAPQEAAVGGAVAVFDKPGNVPGRSV
jgi:hypothetical protein